MIGEKQVATKIAQKLAPPSQHPELHLKDLQHHLHLIQFALYLKLK
jgi:hypothetical protein